MATRREFVAGTIAVLAAPGWRVAAAQDNARERLYRIGILDRLSAGANAANLVQFQDGMKELGYIEGRNLLTDYRFSPRPERLPELAAMLVRKKADVIVTRGTLATIAAKNAPGKTPVVAAGVADPVEVKLVASFEHPGGKVTGLGFVVKEIETRRVDILRALAPDCRRIAALLDMANPAIAGTWKLTEQAARSFGMQATLIDVRKAEDAIPAIQAAVSKGAQGLVVRIGLLGEQQRRAFVAETLKRKLPTIYASRVFVDAGGLVSYGLNASDLYYRAASFVDKLFKGANPAELPMEKPTKFEFVVNRRTLHALGLVLPPDLLLKSDEII